MENDLQKPVVPSEPQLDQRDEHDEHFDASRRRLAKAGLAAAVLMTVASRSAMAGGGYRGGGGGYKDKNDKGCTLSAWMSAGSGPNKPKCFGRTCNYWKNNYSSKWSSPCYSGGGFNYSNWNYNSSDKTASFKSICGSYPLDYTPQPPSWRGEEDPGPSMWSLISNDPNGNTLAAQACAAFLSAADPDVPYGYTLDECVALYKANVSTNPTGLYNMFKLLNERVA